MTNDQPIIATVRKPEHVDKRYVSPDELRRLADAVIPGSVADVLRLAADTIEELEIQLWEFMISTLHVPKVREDTKYLLDDIERHGR